MDNLNKGRSLNQLANLLYLQYQEEKGEAKKAPQRRRAG